MATGSTLPSTREIELETLLHERDTLIATLTVAHFPLLSSDIFHAEIEDHLLTRMLVLD